jgi:hypothetical protein
MADHKYWYGMFKLLEEEGIGYQPWGCTVTFYDLNSSSYVIIDKTKVEDYLISNKIEELITYVKLQLLF